MKLVGPPTLCVTITTPLKSKELTEAAVESYSLQQFEKKKYTKVSYIWLNLEILAHKNF